MNTYEIDGKIYVQKPLVLAQIKQMTGVIAKVMQLGGFDLNAGPLGLIDTLGDELPTAMAIVLTPEGTDPRTKDIPALAEILELHMTLEQGVQVITDFFDCNPILLLLGKLQGMIGSIKKAIPTKTGLTSSPASLQAEISPKETQSSGA